MRKIYALATAMMVSAFGFAQTNVTFRVNMNNQTVSANGVHVAGNFDNNGSSGTAWSPSAYPMTDADNDGIYEATIALNEGMYEFKFINDNDWAGGENVPLAAQVGGGNSNRWAYVAGTNDTVGAICFNEVVNCGMTGVVLQVNMATQTVGQFGVAAPGSYQAWDPGTAAMHNPDGSNIYKRIVEVATGTTMQYKFVNGDSWADVVETVPSTCGVDDGNGGYNREITASADTLVKAFCFGSCDECATSDVTFTVDMSNEASIDPAGVFVAGTFNGWSDTDVLIDNGNGTWSVTLPLQPQTHNYKFKNGPNGWEGGFSGDRVINVTSNDTAVKYCFNTLDTACPTWPDSSMVTFRVDVAAVASQVSADPDSGGVYVMGGFTNPTWQGGALQLTQEGATDIYSGTFKVGGNTDVLFKYVLNKPNTSLAVEESADFSALGGCGVDNGGFSDNRLIVRSAADTSFCFTFDACDACGTTGLNAINEEGFGLSVYPNPFSDATVIEFAQDGDYNLIITDLTGKVVRTARVQGGSRYDLNASDLKDGLYILQATDANMNVSTTKLIVQ